MSYNGAAGILFLITQKQLTWKTPGIMVHELYKDIHVMGEEE